MCVFVMCWLGRYFLVGKIPSWLNFLAAECLAFLPLPLSLPPISKVHYYKFVYNPDRNPLFRFSYREVSKQHILNSLHGPQINQTLLHYQKIFYLFCVPTMSSNVSNNFFFSLHNKSWGLRGTCAPVSSAKFTSQAGLSLEVRQGPEDISTLLPPYRPLPSMFPHRTEKTDAWIFRVVYKNYIS